MSPQKCFSWEARPDVDGALKKLLDSGYSYNECATKLNLQYDLNLRREQTRGRARTMGWMSSATVFQKWENREKVIVKETREPMEQEAEKVLAWLLKEPLSVGEISRRLDRSKDTVIKIIDLLRNQNYDVSPREEEGKVVLERAPQKEFKPHELKPIYRNYLKVGVISDSHLTSKYQQLTLLNTCYKIGEEENIDFMVFCGDMVEGKGMYAGQDYEIFLHGLDEQKEYAIEQFPKSKKFKTMVVGGSHDLSWKKKVGFNILRAICAERKDLKFVGDIGGTFRIKGLTFEVLHPSGGIPYSRSYRPQKIVEGALGDIIDKIRTTKDTTAIPQFYLMGHLHVVNWTPYLGIHAYLVPCLQSVTPYLKAKGLSPQLGMMIIEISFDGKGNVTRLIHDFRAMNHLIKENDY